MKAIPLLLASALNSLLTYFLLALRWIFLVFSYSAAPLRFFLCAFKSFSLSFDFLQ